MLLSWRLRKTSGCRMYGFTMALSRKVQDDKELVEDLRAPYCENASEDDEKIGIDWGCAHSDDSSNDEDAAQRRGHQLVSLRSLMSCLHEV